MELLKDWEARREQQRQKVTRSVLVRDQPIDVSTPDGRQDGRMLAPTPCEPDHGRGLRQGEPPAVARADRGKRRLRTIGNFLAGPRSPGADPRRFCALRRP